MKTLKDNTNQCTVYNVQLTVKDRGTKRILQTAIFLCSLLLVLCLASCFTPFTTNDSNLTLSFGGDARSVSDEILSRMEYSAILTGPGEQLTIPVAAGQSSINLTVKIGRWDIQVYAYLDGDMDRPFGEGSASLEVLAGQDNHVVINMKMISYDFRIFLSADGLTDGHFSFPEEIFGYSFVQPLLVSVDNIGENPSGELRVSLEGDNAESFMLSKTSIGNLNTHGADTFTVVPATGLNGGTYTATVRVTGGNGIDESFTVSFRVIPVYTVTFDTDGGTPAIESANVVEGELVTKPADPQRYPYHFVYWFNPVTEAIWDFDNDVVMDNMTLKAFWTDMNVYTVTFDTDGGSAISSINVIDGELATRPAVDPTRESHTFDDWLGPDGTVWDFNTPITANITLTAKWLKVFTVRFNSNFSTSVSGNTGSMADQTYSEGVSYTLPTIGFTRPSYNFKGWTTTANPAINAAIQFDPGATYSNTTAAAGATVNLYAVWTLALNVGDTGPGGGIIYYVNEDGFDVVGYGTEGQTGCFAGYKAHYLEVAPEYASTALMWGNNNPDTIDNVTTYNNIDYTTSSNPIIGNGRKDTQLIIAEYGISTEYAARAAANYTTNDGKTNDWFLPSHTELNRIFTSSIDINMTDPDIRSWSSSQYVEIPTGPVGGNRYYALAIYYETSLDRIANWLGVKNTEQHVRAIRAF